MFFSEDDSILTNIYKIVKKRGSKGIVYEDLNKNLSKNYIKFKQCKYLASHYCRKLFKLGLVDILNHKIKKRNTWVKIIKDKEFGGLQYDDINNPEIVLERPKESLYEDADADNFSVSSEINLSQSHSIDRNMFKFEIDKSIEFNLLKIFYIDYKNNNRGFLLIELG